MAIINDGGGRANSPVIRKSPSPLFNKTASRSRASTASTPPTTQGSYDRAPLYPPDYGGPGGGDYGGGNPMPAPPPRPSREDFLAGDSGYKAQQAALKKALEDYTTNYNAELGQYDVDYKRGIRNLGYDAAVEDDPATPQNEAMAAKWDLHDTNRASGRSYQNQQNDFASRGLLKSSLYAQAVNDLMRSLEDQRGSIDTARTNFRSEKERGFNTYKNENKSQNDLALAEAISRYAAMYGA